MELEVTRPWEIGNLDHDRWGWLRRGWQRHSCLNLGLTDLGIAGRVENCGLVGLLVAWLTRGGLVVSGARIWDFCRIWILKDFTFTHKATHTKFEEIDVGLILTLCFLFFNVCDDFLKNVLVYFWVFFFFFWREIFDHSNAYVTFLNVNLIFFINIFLAK